MRYLYLTYSMSALCTSACVLQQIIPGQIIRLMMTFKLTGSYWSSGSGVIKENNQTLDSIDFWDLRFPPTKPCILAHFVTKTGPFGNFWDGASHPCPLPPRTNTPPNTKYFAHFEPISAEPCITDNFLGGQIWAINGQV